jgi:hypothetical protein
MKARWLLLASLSALPAVGLSASDTPDWGKVEAAAHAYSKEPSCTNASSLIALIPDRALAREERIDGATSEVLYRLLPPLEGLMLYGDACATRVAFRLCRVADAAFAEDLYAALGALATTRPLLFLQETARSGQGCDVVTFYWTDYSEPEARAERKLRLERLQQPVPAALKSLRSKCVQLLRSSP